MPEDFKAELNSDYMYDLVIENGDFVIAESTYQHQGLLFLSAKGDWKENPDRCVDGSRYVETSDDAGLAREIGTQFSLDGMRVERVNINIPKVKIVAEYLLNEK